MNKYQMLYGSSLVLIGMGVLLSGIGLFQMRGLIYFGICVFFLGLGLLGTWLSKAYIYICRECYLRIGVSVKEALFAMPAGTGSRRIYCPKCRRKTACKARRVSLRVHIY